MSKRRHRQTFDGTLGHQIAPPRGRSAELSKLEASSKVSPEPREDATKIVPNCENDDSPAKLDIADAIAKEIDMTWAIIAVIEILLRDSGDDKYAQGGLRLAHAHLDGLCAIQEEVNRVWHSE
jgi:hypothetical protein